ncbi:MAG: nucleotidyl transferase AbiEii/AbiGii toxin family protein [Myxococcales bacterium]|nr:nucleotidyl transferase AbiEii/AbiGii toxin family protein [Myxococcales bacterium]
MGRIRKTGGAASAVQPGFSQAIKDLVAWLDTVGQPYSVIGGMAVIAHGQARTTQDIDLAWVPTGPTAAAKLLAAAKAYGFAPRIKNAAAFAEQNLVLLVVHQPTGVPIDISFAMQEFELRAARNAKRRKLFGVAIPVVGLSDLIIYKMIAARTQDVADVEMLLTSNDIIDPKAIRRTLREFDALLETDRAGEFDRAWRVSGRRG